MRVDYVRLGVAVWCGVVLCDYNTTLVNSRLGCTRLWQLRAKIKSVQQINEIFLCIFTYIKK